MLRESCFRNAASDAGSRSIALVLVGGILTAGVGAAAPVGRKGIDVLQVQGFLDPPNVSRARRDPASERTPLDHADPAARLRGSMDADIRPVLRDVTRSKVPIVVWVGPSGATAQGVAVELLEAAHLSYVASGATAGPAHPVALDHPDAVSLAMVRARFARWRPTTTATPRPPPASPTTSSIPRRPRGARRSTA